MTPALGDTGPIAPPPPIGPRAVDPKAPALRPSCFGIEDLPETMRGAAPESIERHASPPAEEPAPTQPPRPRRGGDDQRRSFTTEVDMCEIDDRGRPEAPWAARARELSRSEIVISSRRMCYTGRQVLVLIHLVDHTPVAIFGVVEACEYDGEGQYRVEIGLLEMPTNRHIREWIAARSGKTWRS